MRGELSFSRTPFFHTHRHIYTHSTTHTHSIENHFTIHFVMKTTHTIYYGPNPHYKIPLIPTTMLHPTHNTT